LAADFQSRAHAKKQLGWTMTTLAAGSLDMGPLSGLCDKTKTRKSTSQGRWSKKPVNL
jgi:hypothetical protein